MLRTGGKVLVDQLALHGAELERPRHLVEPDLARDHRATSMSPSAMARSDSPNSIGS